MNGCLKLSAKKAYFIVTSILTFVVVVGGLVIIYKNDNSNSVDWAQNLICTFTALWIPSPIDHVKKTIEKGPTLIDEGIKEMNETDTMRQSQGSYIPDTPSSPMSSDLSAMSKTKSVKKSIDAVMNSTYNKPDQLDPSEPSASENWDYDAVQNQIGYQQKQSDNVVIDMPQNDAEIDSYITKITENIKDTITNKLFGGK